MKARIAFALLVAGSCATWFLAQGCGGDDASQGDATNDGTTGNDTGSGSDTGTGNDTGSGSDTGTGNDTGTGSDTGTGNDGGILYRCGFQDASMVNDCAQCAGFTLDCVFCSTTDASVMEGRCGSLGNGCFAGNNTGFASCPCSAGDASSCPEGYQVCRQGQGNSYACHSCGDQNTNGLTCEKGGTCDALDGGCL